MNTWIWSASFSPWPGTPLCERCARHKWTGHRFKSQVTHPHVGREGWEKLEMETTATQAFTPQTSVKQSHDPLHFHRGQAHLYVKDARATNEQVTVSNLRWPIQKKNPSIKTAKEVSGLPIKQIVQRVGECGTKGETNARSQSFAEWRRVWFSQLSQKHTTPSPDQLLMRAASEAACTALRMALAAALPDIKESEHQLGALSIWTTFLTKISIFMHHMSMLEKMANRRRDPQHGS